MFAIKHNQPAKVVHTQYLTSKMNSSEIDTYLKHLPVNSSGVYASDHLPLRLPSSSALVVNTDPHTKSGTHWIAIFLDANGKMEYMDSFGQPPLIPDHIKFIRRNSCCYRYNVQPLQSYGTSVCGQYCLVYLYLRSHGYAMKDFTTLFSEDVNKNDLIVDKIFKRLYT